MADQEKRILETTRRVNPGAEKWIGINVPILDHGFVTLVDYMGSDQDIEDAARVSYGEGTRKVSQTEGLLRYLMRHEHTSPFEMVELKFHAKMPIFVARQWVRHRTASLNEYSARYSVVKNEFFVPEPDAIALQSSDNKQGRGEIVDSNIAEEVKGKLSDFYEGAHNLYDWLLGAGVAKELARIPLPVAAYTEWYWKINLHNMLHFLKLRMDKHAQLEIRQYASAMADIVRDIVPITWKAFEDYQLNATRLTSPEREALVIMLTRRRTSFMPTEILSTLNEVGVTNKRESEEFVEKLRALGLIEE